VVFYCHLTSPPFIARRMPPMSSHFKTARLKFKLWAISIYIYNKFYCFGSQLNIHLVVLIVFVDGFIKPYTPGSLREPAETFLFPSNWLTLPLSFGLLMSPWGGHSVFPNIYRDMRHPHKFPKAVKVTFTFTVRKIQSAILASLTQSSVSSRLCYSCSGAVDVW
jgi:hypothetical protein